MDLKTVWSPEAIESFPWTGRVVPELEDEKIRERLVYSYRVVYQVQATPILTVAVTHGARLIESISDRLERGE